MGAPPKEILDDPAAMTAWYESQTRDTAEGQPKPARRARLTRASAIEIRPVVWAWTDQASGRIPAGALTITAGREGTGKSSFGIWLAAQITRGVLPGAYFGQPRSVFYVAVEDSWQYTIAPRLTAAGADLDRVFRFEVVSDDDEELMLSLPFDNRLLEDEMTRENVALVVIDPLMSVMSEKIDTHRTREVRMALDPLAKIADRTGSIMLGIAHFNKAGGTDASSLLSGSHAFRDVPRAIFGFARDDSDGSRVMTQVKNSLGKDDLPSLAYQIESTQIDTRYGQADTGRFVFLGESDRSVADVLRDSHGGDEDRSERDEAADWLTDYLLSSGGSAAASDAIKAAAGHGIAKTTLTRARKRARVHSAKLGMTGGWVWTLEESTEEPEESKNQEVNSSVPSVDSSAPPVCSGIDPGGCSNSNCRAFGTCVEVEQ